MFFLDTNRLPLVSIVATIGCISSLCAAAVYVSSAISIRIREFRDIHKYLIDDVSYLDTFRFVFFFVAILTMVVGLATLFVDCSKLNSRYTGVPMCRFIEDSIPNAAVSTEKSRKQKAIFSYILCIQLACFLLVLQMVWLYMFHRISEMQIYAQVHQKSCKTPFIANAIEKNLTKPCYVKADLISMLVTWNIVAINYFFFFRMGSSA